MAVVARRPAPADAGPSPRPLSSSPPLLSKATRGASREPHVCPASTHTHADSLSHLLLPCSPSFVVGPSRPSALTPPTALRPARPTQMLSRSRIAVRQLRTAPTARAISVWSNVPAGRPDPILGALVSLPRRSSCSALTLDLTCRYHRGVQEGLEPAEDQSRCRRLPRRRRQALRPPLGPRRASLASPFLPARAS